MLTVTPRGPILRARARVNWRGQELDQRDDVVDVAETAGDAGARRPGHRLWVLGGEVKRRVDGQALCGVWEWADRHVNDVHRARRAYDAVRARRGADGA